MEDVFRTTDEASVALLRGLRAGTVFHSFVHRADVCSAVPEELVAGLQPVPGTDATDDGYHSVWYIYCPKRYKNSQGVARGHRQRAVETAKEMCWHSETGPKPVQGVPGATVCDLSYGRKEEQEEVPGRRRQRQRFERMGWKMKEFDDTQGGGGDHVLCRVHRASSSLAKTKFKKPSSSKRKAAGDHPQAPPTKLIHDEQVQEQVQMQTQQDAAALFTNNAYAYPAMPYYGCGPPEEVDPVTMIGESEAEHGGGGEFNVEELLNMQQSEAAEHRGDLAAGFNLQELLLNLEEFLNADEQVQRALGVAPVAGDVQPEHGGEFSFRFQDLLNTDEWKGFEDFLAEGEQGLQQPRREPEQQVGVFLVQGHAAVC